jgi:hypothetical protein
MGSTGRKRHGTESAGKSFAIDPESSLNAGKPAASQAPSPRRTTVSMTVSTTDLRRNDSILSR